MIKINIYSSENNIDGDLAAPFTKTTITKDSITTSTTTANHNYNQGFP